MRYLPVIAATAFTLMSTVSVAQRIDCLSINQDLDKVSELKSSGEYRHLKDTKTAPSFDYDNQRTFADYLTFAKSHIKALSPKAHLPCPIDNYVTQAMNKPVESLIVADVVAPFELSAGNNKKGILLIHGLTDSPYLFHDLAEFFHQSGFNVRTLLLPGHGTAAEALIDVSYKEWQQATQFAIDKAKQDFDQVYLGGFSTGGALILDNLLSQQESTDRIKGVMLWAPASKAKSSAAGLAQVVDWIPFLDYASKAADIDFAKYESFPLNAGAQVHSLMKRLNKRLERVANTPTIPLFTATTEFDATIDTAATIDLLSQWHNKKSDKQHDTLFYFGSEQSLTVLPAAVTRIYPICSEASYCKSIVNVAHTSVTNAPTNPHYGWNGSYRNCEAVASESDYVTCKTTQEVKLGETTKENLTQYGSLQRLTFNPAYQEMLKHLSNFIENTGGGL